MVSSSCQVFACGICFVALVGFAVTMGHPEWKITSRGTAVVVLTYMHQGLWVNCAGSSLGVSQCRFHWTVIGLPAYLRASQAMMIIGMLLSLFGISVALMGLKCSQIGGDDEKLKGRIVGFGGMMNILAGLAVISVVSFYAWQTTIEYFGPEAGPKYEYGVALYFGWASSVLAFVGGAMLSSSFTCCKPSMPKIPRPSYSAATKGAAKSSMKGYGRNAYV
uniref:claudin-7-like n=1 Tax=Myxine glutinosa TaxID=7769 RepID=UPI00358F03B2